MRLLLTFLIGLAPAAAMALDPQLPSPRFNDVKIKPAGRSIERSLADRLSETPSIKDFGGPVNGDWTAAFQAAEASGVPRILLPAGRYPTTFNHYQAISKTYTGPGQLVVGANSSGDVGVAEAPHRSFITSPLPEVPDDRLQAFNADWSKAVPGGAAYTFIGAGATGTPKTKYTNFPQLSQTFRIFDNTAGFNTDLADHAKGRSGIFADVLRAYQGGQGDLVGQTLLMQIYSSRTGATHWLASPAVVGRNGGFGASGGAEGAYLNESEFIFNDNGVAVTAIDRIRNYNRRNGGKSLHQVWGHDRPQSSGSVPIDFFYAPSGKARRGYDTTAADFGAEGAALVLSAGQKIYFNAISTPDPVMGTQFGATELGAASAVFDPSTKTLRIDPGAGNTLAIDNLPTSAAGLSAGSIYRDANNFLRVTPSANK